LHRRLSSGSSNTELEFKTRQQVIKQNRLQAELTRFKLPQWRPLLVTSSLIFLLAVIITPSRRLLGDGGLPFALASPPVDYLIYTSQLATAQNGTQSVTSILPAVKTIYAPSVANNSNSQQAAASRRLDELADRVLGLVRNSSRHNLQDNSNKLIDLAAVQYAWNLMERQAELYMQNRVHALRPFVQELLAEAQLSTACSQSISLWLDELAELKQWATLMWNSWGQFPPAGIFQGSYTDLGSYSGCMSIADNELIGKSQYCMLDFQPIIPARPRFHSIFKRILSHNGHEQRLDRGDFELDSGEEISSAHAAHGFASHRFKELFKTASQTNNNNNNNKYLKRTIDAQQGANKSHTTNELVADSMTRPGLNITLKAEALIELAKKAQYFYYVSFRIGACLPTKCSKEDVKQLAQTGK
jgi:hypothetical protein